MIPNESGWYIGRYKYKDGAFGSWQPLYVTYNDTCKFWEAIEDNMALAASDFQFHSRIPMPDATPEETPEERKSNDGE